MKEPLFENVETINLEKSVMLQNKTYLPPVMLEVAQGPINQADASHIIFGMQTIISRLNDTIKPIAR